jgi:glycosyltransferase involved in cell wall biosynthesis/predicted MFS family arabinose efflux permease
MLRGDDMKRTGPTAHRARFGPTWPAGGWAEGAVARLAAATGAVGVAGAMVVTSVSLFLANAVHAAPLMIGLFFAGRGAAEIVTDLFVGVLSDRLRSRRTLLAACCLLSALGALSYLWLRNYYALLASGAIFFGTGGATFAQFFAYTREFAEARGRAVTLFNSALRSVTSAAWVVGPPVGFYLLSKDGFTTLYAVAAALYVAGAVLCRWGLPEVPKLAGDAGPARPGGPGRRAWAGLSVREPFRGLATRTYLLLGAIVLLLTVNQMYQIDIALFVTKDLRLGTGLTGWLVGLAAAIEVPATILIGVKADRLGRLRLVLLGAVGAAAFFCLLPFATTVPELLLLQVPNAAWTSVIMTIPVVMLQDDVPDRAGLSSSLYATAFKAGVLFGGSFTGVTAAVVGYTDVFWVCAGLSLVAGVMLVARTAIGVPLRCSVVVPTYNRAGLLRHTLESLARQRLPDGRFEVIVVDDGSSDDTAAVAESFRGRLDLSYHFQPDEGYRVARARNVGISHARADVCVFVDSGVMPHSGCLAAYLDSHRRASGPVAVCGYVYGFNEDNEDGGQIAAAIDYANPDATIARFAAAASWLDIREEFYAKYGDDFGDLPAPWLMFWTCNVSAPTAWLREVGMFDEAYRSWGAEDVDLSYRLHRAGVRFVLSRQASAIHVPHPKSYEANMAAVAGNYRYFAAKYGTPIAQLVDGNHFFVINDIIAERGLPGCAEFEAARAAEAQRSRAHPAGQSASGPGRTYL